MDKFKVIRYYIHPDFLRELFEDEEKLEEFAEAVERDVLYKLGKCADIERYCQNNNAIVKELSEKLEKERSEEDVRHKENSQDV